jgi:Protein of unknown function (DUF2393)
VAKRVSRGCLGFFALGDLGVQHRCIPSRSAARRLLRSSSSTQIPIRNRCTIPLVSSGPQLVRPAAPAERNWLPVAIAAAVVLAVLGGLILFLGRGKGAPPVTPISAKADAYAPNLPITNLAMSESSNLAGGKVTYLDGHIANKGDRTVTGITVQVLFRDYAKEVAQNETQPLELIRTRDPYVDVEPVSAAPLKPGDERDFRLIFDTVADGWNGDYPEIRIVHVGTN